MVEVKRTVMLVTEQTTIPDRAPKDSKYPTKLWSVEVFVLDHDGTQVDANVFSKAIYNLHPSFENSIQTTDKPPFRCQNEGWGEFDMTIDLFAVGDGEKHTIAHDLNFIKPRYEAKHEIIFNNPKPNLIDALRRSGPVPGDANRAQTDTADASDAEKPSMQGLRKTRVSITRRRRKTAYNNNDAAVQSIGKPSPNQAISSPRTPNIKTITVPCSIDRTPLPARAPTSEIPSATARLGDPTDGESVTKYALEQPAPSHEKRLSLPSHNQTSSLETTTTSLEDTTISNAADETETGQTVRLRQRGCSLPHASTEHAASAASKPRKRQRRSNTSTPVTPKFISTLNHMALRARLECPQALNIPSLPPTPVQKSTDREKIILARSITPDLDFRKRAPSQPSHEENITCQERPPKRLRVVSNTVTSRPDIRQAIKLIRQGDELSDNAIVASLRAVGFNESEISDPIVTATPPRPYRRYTPRLDDQNFVVFPIYHPDVGHWTVGIAADGVIHHYDSLGDGTLDSEIEQRIKDHLNAGKISLPKSTWTLNPAKSAQQANEKDCGMFTIVNAIYHVCGMHDQIDEDIWPGIICTWRKIFSKILQSRIIGESTPTPGDLESLGVSVGEMDRDFPLSTAKIQSCFKKALTETTTRLGKLKNEPGLDTEIAQLTMILSLISATNIPGTPEFAPNVISQLLQKQELQREIKMLTTRTKKQQAVIDILGAVCDDWKADAQRTITEIKRLLLGDYEGETGWGEAENRLRSVEL